MNKLIISTIAIILNGVILMAQNIKYINIKGVEVPLIYMQSSKLPKIDLQIVFKNSGKKNSDKAGLSHMVSEVLSSGTMSKNENEFYEDLELRAISFSVGSGYETLNFNISSLKDEFEIAINSLSSVFKSPRLEAKNITRIKEKLHSQILEKQNDFDYVSSVGLNKILFKESNLAYELIGNVDSIKSVSLKDVDDFIKSHITLSNAIIVIGGDYDDKDMALIEKALKVLNVGKSITNKKITVNKVKVEKREITNTEQAYIQFGSSYFLKPNDKDSYKSKVASFILGQSGFGSRLMEEIRVKRGLAYSAYSYVSLESDFSYFKGYLQTKLENEKEAIDIVKKTINKFVDKGVSKKELNSAKKFILGSFPLKNEMLSSRLHQVFADFYKGREVGAYKNDLEKIENLTLKELNDFISKHNEIKNLSFYILTKEK